MPAPGVGLVWGEPGPGGPAPRGVPGWGRTCSQGVPGSSIGYRHSRLSSFGTSNFFKKMCVPARGYFYSLSSQLRSPLAGAVALFVLRLLHSTKFLW